MEIFGTLLGGISAGCVTPLYFHLMGLLVFSGTTYCGKFGQYNFLNLLISLIQRGSTMMDLGSKAVKCIPDSVHTRESVT